MLHLCLTVLFIVVSAQPTSAASALTSSRDMYAFWCEGERAGTPMCAHHALSLKLSKTTDLTERKAISEQIKGVFATAKSTTGGTPGSLNPFAKSYSEMKMAYCATNPAGAKILCSTAASRYAPSSSPTTPSSTTQAMEWYCSKESGGAQQQNICKRADIMKKMRSTTSMDERKTLSEQLKAYPSAPYGTMQAVYADFCKLKTSTELPLCLSLRRTAESKQMNKWYCGQEAHKDGLWCQRTALLDKLNKVPPSVGGVISEERKALAAQMSTLMKPSGAGDSPSKKLSAEIAAAKAAYCADNKELSFCKSPVPRIRH